MDQDEEFWKLPGVTFVPHQETTRALLGALDDALTALSDDERTYLKHRRDKEAHPSLDGWALGKAKDGGLRDKVWVFGQDIQIEHADAAISRLFHASGRSETQMIVTMAQRLAPKFRAVDHACDGVLRLSVR